MGSRMRIAIDARTATGWRTGVGNYTRSLCRRLIARSDTDTFILFTDSRRESAEIFPQSARVQLAETRIPAKRRYLYVWENYVLPRRLTRLRADVFHAPAFALPRHKLHQGSVATIHDILFLTMPDGRRRGASWLFDRQVESSIANADVLIAVSHTTKREIIERFGVDPERIRVIYPPTLEDRAPLERPQIWATLQRRGLRPPYVLSVGTLEPRKNQARLVDAFSAIADQYRTLQLVVAGHNAGQGDDVVQAVASSAVHSRIHLLGYVTDHELAELYRHCEAFIFPSLAEGFGYPILESWSFDVPVVTSQTSSMPEVAGDAAVFVDPFSVDSIAAGIEAVVSDGTLRSQIVKRGRLRLSAFDSRRAVDLTLDAYRLALNMSSGR